MSSQEHYRDPAESKPFTFEEAKVLLATARAEAPKIIEADSNSNQYWKELEHNQYESARIALEKLLAQKEHFKHVFRTEKGSIYFVTTDDRAIRIKSSLVEGKELLGIRDTHQKIFFVDEGEINFLKNTFDMTQLINRPIKRSECAVGLYPFEVNEDESYAFPLQVDQESFMILPPRDWNKKMHIHRGHKISEVLK